MFEQAFKNIDNVLWKEAGCTTELDYTEQTSWLLFLKYLDGLEQDLADEAALDGKKYRYILDRPYRWDTWAAPKGKDGELDHNKALTGDDLRDLVNQKLFPYLHGFTQRATGPNTIEYKIGEIFGEIKNKISSGYNMREIIEQIDALRFRSQAEKHELSHLYEAKIKNMGNAGRNGGEYYTPRPLIRAIVQVVKPKIGERIYDGAVGSAGFLCEAYDYLKETNPKRTTAQDRVLQERTFYGKEKKSLAYVIAIMNMILHGIEAPNILRTNTLSENLADIQERDRYEVVLANPPFGGKERKEVQQNFPIRTKQSACTAPSVWHATTYACTPNPCPLSAGACCYANGSCQVPTQQQYLEGGGVYQGNLTSCTPSPCPAAAACCLAVGYCLLRTETACAALNPPGTWFVERISCIPTPCLSSWTGSCCHYDGSCIVTSLAACAGSWTPSGTCAPNLCPAPDVEGACCTLQGTCAITFVGGCLPPSQWHADWRGCNPNPCPIAEGACCTPNGACTVTTEGNCDPSSIWRGDLTSCEPNQCPTLPTERTSWGQIKDSFR